MVNLRPWHSSAGAALLSSTLLTLTPSINASDLKTTHRAFADILSTTLHTNDNDCTSTWGVSMMLGLLHPGSDGTTATEMCDILGFSCDDDADLAWEDIAARLDSKYGGQCLGGFGGTCYERAPTLEVADSVWVDEGTALKASYRGAVGDFLYETDFDDTGAGDVVNRWVDESTEGLIDSIIDEGIIPYDLVAVNSIYLNASWQFAFQESRTNEDYFYPNGIRDDTASAVSSHFMHMVEYLYYSDEALPGFQVVRMDYLSSSLSMIVALPLGVGISSDVKPSDVLAVLPDLKWTKVALAFPKFMFASTYGDELLTALEDLGLMSPFTKGFCTIFENDMCAFLSFVRQKTFINVHEKGTEAAAVTGGGVATALPPPEDPILFSADRPFLFYIYDAEEELVLFEGRVGKPDIPDGSSAPLQSRHSDDDFWQANFNENPLIPAVPAQPQTTPTQTTATTAASQAQTTPPQTAPPQTTGAAVQSTTTTSPEVTRPQTTPESTGAETRGIDAADDSSSPGWNRLIVLLAALGSFVTLHLTDLLFAL